MNLKDILELIDKVAQSGIAGVEIEHAGTKVKIDGKHSAPQVIHSFVNESRGGGEGGGQLLSSMPLSSLPSPASAPAPAAEPAKKDLASDPGIHIITSPIVGTFYRAANPESPSFVNVGDRISKGKVLCIVEAMKLMNEIESDIDGTIVEIYPQNAQPVEYGEKLFAVKI